MPFQNIIYEKDEKERIATVTLNRPDKLNSMSVGLRDELDMVIDDLEADDNTRVVVFKGAGRAFCSGYDLGGYRPPPQSPLQEAPAKGMDQTRFPSTGPSWTRRRFQLSAERWLRLFHVRQCTIAQVHGYCLAGGLDFIGVCDIVFAAENAKLGQPQARAMGHLHTFALWPTHLGMRKTKEWMFTGDSISGKEAERLGLINRAVPAEQLEKEVLKYARRVAKCSLDYIYAHKDITNRWFEAMGMYSSMRAAGDMDAVLLNSPLSQEFSRRIREDGLKSALEWRDGPFKEEG
ncbi:MAG: enoyl-CoA hydratase/isomerase family protein [Chloroflexi bacterium]|nr:enoyl-CoA hydratase/isomerase family protein [Chloroflexota bacterium]